MISVKFLIIGIVITVLLAFTHLMFNTMLPWAEEEGKSTEYKILLAIVTFVVSPIYMLRMFYNIIKTVLKKKKNENNED